MKGIIALDIDGTITVDHNNIEPDVVAFLKKINAEGWALIFITGRTFLWGYEVLKHLPFPYHFAVQNGAIILKMPERKVVSKKYLDSKILPAMEEICQDEPSDFIIYTGYENDDICYYRPERFSAQLLQYVQERTKVLKEKWIPLTSYDMLPVREFASVKCFGDAKSAQRLAAKIEAQLGLHVPLIRDPFNMDFFVAQATHPEVSKGYALKDYAKLSAFKGPLIAAGDDNNDKSMLEIADVRVAMATAPQDILAKAHIVAPPALEKGIIAGLTEAIKLASKTQTSQKKQEGRDE